MPAPDQIGRYRVERRLGSGAFAVVWLAHDDRLHAPVAVKVMAENWAYRLDIRERFLAEARLLRKATGGGVVQVFDIGELDDERPYFVMEYADRGTVADRMTAGPVPLSEALGLVSQVTRGVRALHEAGVVHRDIKPSNVLLAGGGAEGQERVLVADLGLAKNLAQASGLTVVAGSTGYMAPEQAEPFDGIDARADVYSLGAVLYHLVTGAVPGPPGQVMAPGRLREGLPPEVDDAVARAMQPDREQRWPTAAAFADEIDRLAERFSAAEQAGPTAWPGSDPEQWSGVQPASPGMQPWSGVRLEPGAQPESEARPESAAFESDARSASGAGASGSSGAAGSPWAAGGSGASPGVPAAGASGSAGNSGIPQQPGGPGGSGASEVPGASAASPAPAAPFASDAPGTAGTPGAPGESGAFGAPGSSGTPGNPEVSGGMAAYGTPGVSGGAGMPGSPGISGTPGTPEAPGTPGAPAAPGAPSPPVPSGSTVVPPVRRAAASGSPPVPPPGPSPAAASVPTDVAEPSPVPQQGAAASSSRPRRRGRAFAIGAAVVVLLAGAGAYVMSMDQPPSPSTVRVKDSTQRVSVEIPADWSDQIVDTGWNPASLGLRGQHAPGLTVADNVRRWQDLTTEVSGIFVGTGSKSAPGKGEARALREKVAAIEHGACSYKGSRAFDSGSWKGSIRSWSSCNSPGHSLEEIGLTSKRAGVPPVYVQIRCDEKCADRTDKVLKSLRVRGS